MDVANSSQPVVVNAAAAPIAGAPEGICPDNVMQQLSGTKPWVRLIAVLGFIGGGFMALAGLLIMVLGSSIMPKQFGAVGAGIGFIGIFYLIGAALYIVLAAYLNGYASAIGRAMTGAGFKSVAEALNCQRMFWKITGILAIIGIGLVVLGIIIGVIVGIAAAAH